MSVVPQSLAELLPEALHVQCYTADVPKGGWLFHLGDAPQWMFYVAGGEVVLERMGPQGTVLVLQRQRSGFVAEASLHAARYHCDARVTRPAQIVRLPLRALNEALATDAAFALRWIAMLNAEVRRLRQQCERLSLKRVQDRLLHWLGSAASPGPAVPVGGVKSLAAELGVSHEALYRCIADLEAAGQLQRTAQGVWRIASDGAAPAQRPAGRLGTPSGC